MRLANFVLLLFGGLLKGATKVLTHVTPTLDGEHVVCRARVAPLELTVKITHDRRNMCRKPPCLIGSM